jgi:hypothetical protein
VPFVSSFLCSPLRFFSGSHFLCPSTFFFVLVPFPLSPFSPSPIPLPTGKSLISPFLHSISTVPPLFTSFPSLFSSFAMVLLYLSFLFCKIVRSLSMNIFSISFFSLSFLFVSSLFLSHSTIPFPLVLVNVVAIFDFSFLYVFFYQIFYVLFDLPLTFSFTYPSYYHYVIFSSSPFFILHFPSQPCYSHVVFLFLPFLFFILK